MRATKIRTGLRSLLSALLTFLLAASFAPQSIYAQDDGSDQDEEETGLSDGKDGDEGGSKNGKKKGKKGKTEVLSVDEEYVRDNIKGFIYPSSLKFLEDGRAAMVFDFRKKSDDHIDIFSPKVGSRVTNKFRWTLPDEEYWSMADGNDIGLRISNSGMALLNCWFKDNVEAEITFCNAVNFNKRVYASVIFCNDKGRALGSNLGTQCTMYSKGRPKGGKGRVEPVVYLRSIKNKLVVREGVFEAHRNGRKKSAFKYSQKQFKSGRLGFAWGGDVMGYVAELKITGEIDAEKMAKVMQKGRRR